MTRQFLIEVDDAPLPAPAPGSFDLSTIPRAPRRGGGDAVVEVALYTRRQPWKPRVDGSVASAPRRPTVSEMLAEIEGYVMFGLSPLAAQPFAGIDRPLSLEIGPDMLRASTHGYVDDNAVEYRHGLIAPFFEQSLVNGDVVGGRASISYGDAQFMNLDGYYDDVVNRLAVDGRAVTIKHRREDGVFDTVFKCPGRDWVPGKDRVRLRLSGWEYLLDKPLQQTLYANDALSDIANRPIPVCYGPCSNITPVRVKQQPPTYQWNDGPSQALDKVYVGGVPLVANDIESVDLGTSTFVLKAEPAKAPTCDVRGSKVAGVYLTTTSAVIKDIVVRRAGLAADQVSASHFTQLAADLPGEIQVYVSTDSQVTAYEMVDRLLTPFGWSSFSWTGQLQVGLWKVPSGSPKCALTYDDGIKTLDPVELPGGVYPPPWRVRGGYDRNFTVQSTADLLGDAASTTDPVGGSARRDWLKRAQDLAMAQDAATHDLLHLKAQDPEAWETFFKSKTDAELVLQAYLNLWVGNRSLYKVIADTKPFYFSLDDVVLLQWPRYGLSEGRLGRVCRVREDVYTELTVMV